jgi:MFS family permease
MLAPAMPEIAKKYGSFDYSGYVRLIRNMLLDITDSMILAMIVSISFLSLGLIPLFIAPLSEMYGRKWVNLISSCLPLYY